MLSRYRHTQYATSAYTLPQLPADQGIEVAFAGRSNAGKSSAINAITQQKQLAKTGKTPGRTQMINFFKVSDHHHLVDLPGYGYAKVPEKVKRHWVNTLEQYLATRNCLKGLILIMDCRHPLSQLDWQMIYWAHSSNLALHILLTKADKLGRHAGKQQINNTVKQLQSNGIDASLQLFSALKRQGIEDVYTVLEQWFLD